MRQLPSVSLNRQGIYLFHIKEKQTTTDKAFFISIQKLESRALPTLANTKKKPFDLIYCLFKMNQFHWLLYMLSAEKLKRYLEYYRSWKNTIVKLSCGCGGLSIRVLKEMSVRDGGNFCPQWL